MPQASRKTSSLASKTQPKGHRGVTQVLIVDDHPLFRDGLKLKIDFQDDLKVCAEASNAPEALAAVRANRPDLIVMDLTLDGVGGLDLIKQLNELYGDIPTLVLSMHDESLYAERALRAGARGYLMKQEGAEKLVSALQTLVRGEVYLSETMSARLLGRFVGGKPQSSPSSLDCLSDRELEIFELIGQGNGNRRIAEMLGVSPTTVVSHREHIKQKLKLKSGIELVQYATQWVLDGSRSTRPQG